jgi:HK97 family phage prohead protease
MKSRRKPILVFFRSASWHTTDAIGSVRESTSEPRVIEGIAVPYGVVSAETELTPGGPIVREAFVPGAFKASVDHWMARADGGRLAYRPAHREKPVGTVTSLEDTPAGVAFRASIFETPAGDEYLEQVRSGLNGVSVEAGFSGNPRRMRDGTVLHREAKLHAIAGSISPAYDGARIALRDMMEDSVNCPTCGAAMTAGVAHTCQPAAPLAMPLVDPSPAPPAGERDAAGRTTSLSVAERSRLEEAYVAGRTAGSPRSTITITRAELVYRDAYDGKGQHISYLSDGWKARNGDSAAAERSYRHELQLHDIAVQMERDAVRRMEGDALAGLRAGDVLSTEIPGAYPNDYIPGLFTPRILKGRPMGGFFDHFPISDALPKIFPKTTTSTTVSVQSAEGTNPAASDFATSAVTATPLLYGAETVVSRQVIDGSSPAAEAMLMQDLLEGYAQATETVIKTAVEAGASASGTAITAATPFAGTLGNVIKYFSTRFRGASAQFIPSALFAVLLGQLDSAGRPLLPWTNAINSSGTVADGGSGAVMLGAQTYLSYASTTNVVVTGKSNDYVIFESPVAKFNYEAVTGPAGVRVGCWAYLVVGTRLGSLSVTAA